MASPAWCLAIVAMVVVGSAESTRVVPRVAHRVALPTGRALRAALLGADAGATATVDNDATCKTKKAMVSCATCTSVLRCAFLGGDDKWEYLNTEACPSNKPYCNDGVCQAAMPESCASEPPTADSSFKCPSDGYFPSMTSCTKYYVCVGGKAYPNDCSSFANTVYDQKTSLCVPRSQATCFTLSCNSGNVLAYQPYTPAPWLYAICKDTNPANAVIGQCKQGQAIDVSNPAKPACVLACQKAGRFADPDDTTKTKYYECVDLGSNKFSKPVPGTCPTGSQLQDNQCVTTAATP